MALTNLRALVMLQVRARTLRYDGCDHSAHSSSPLLAHRRRCSASSRSTIPSSRGASQRREPPRRTSNPPSRLSRLPGTAVHEQTHTWGHSLMDLGVGAVMLTGALVRRRAHAKPARRSDSAWRVCRRHAPLVAIGAGRLLAVKAADYHEVVTPWALHPLTPPHTPSHRRTRPQTAPHCHRLPQTPLTPPHTPVQVVSEYGTHWNFFFTLALVAAAAAVATPASARATALCAAALLLLHQAALLCGLAQWVEHAPRRGLLSANKVWRAPAPPQPRARACARALPDQPALGCARLAAGGTGLPTRLPCRLVARRRHRRGLAPARRCSQLVAHAGGARPPHPRAGRRRAAHASAPRTPRTAAHACGGADAWVGPALPPAVRSVIHCRCHGAASVATAVQPGLLALGRRAGAQSARAQLHAREPSRCAVPARHRPSWCCASVLQRASSVQHQLRTSWAR